MTPRSTPAPGSGSVGCPAGGPVDVVGKEGPDRVQVNAVGGRVGALGWLTVGCVGLPPPPHPRLELLRHRFAEPGVEPAHFTDGIELHGPEIDVVEAPVAALVAE